VIDNPAANPLFVPVVGRVGAALGALLVLAVVRQWRRRRHPERRSLLAAVTTAVLLVAALLMSLFAGGFALVILVTVLCILCVREYVAITQPSWGSVVVLYAAMAWAIAAAAAGQVTWLLAVPFAVFLASNAVFVLTDTTEGSQRELGELLVCSIYVVIPLASWIYLRSWVDWGLEFLLLVLPCAWLSDVCGYTAGSILRGPRLAPKISPGKTWSGACASVIGAAFGADVIGTVVPHRSGYVLLALVGAGAGVCAIFGDLVESLVKRVHNVKDAGTLLPGFGGVLDRFDSMLVTVPVMFTVVAVLHVFVP
jgi:phosphatidate cytidylyltransferase